jgi:1,4-dihydroxy-2-naphthoate octaprenyltransferase
MRKRGDSTDQDALVDASEILTSFEDAISSCHTIAVSITAPRFWTSIVGCSTENDYLILDKPVSFPVVSSDKRMRVSFSLNNGANGPEFHGNGIACISLDKQNRILLKPYRISLESANEPAIIERRQNKWQLRQQSPASSKGFRFWLRAVRAISFPLSVLPILIGTSCAMLTGPVNWLLFALALVGGVAAHAGTNLFSDYSDYVKGVDTTNALSSHTGALVDELIDPSRILLAAAACGMITAFVGGVLVWAIGWPILLFGLAGLLGGFFYTGGPKAFKYLGLGEAATGFLMGPLMVCGAFFVQTRTLSLATVILSIAIGLLVSAVSYGNNIRDAFFDRDAGIVTMPVKFGWRLALFLFRAILIVPYLLVGVAVFADHRLAPALVVILSAPWALSIAFRFGKGEKEFAGLSEQAAKCILPLQAIRLHSRFCLFLVVGIVGAKVVSLLM